VVLSQASHNRWEIIGRGGRGSEKLRGISQKKGSWKTSTRRGEKEIF